MASCLTLSSLDEDDDDELESEDELESGDELESEDELDDELELEDCKFESDDDDPEEEESVEDELEFSLSSLEEEGLVIGLPEGEDDFGSATPSFTSEPRRLFSTPKEASELELDDDELDEEELDDEPLESLDFMEASLRFFSLDFDLFLTSLLLFFLSFETSAFVAPIPVRDGRASSESLLEEELLLLEELEESDELELDEELDELEVVTTFRFESFAK